MLVFLSFLPPLTNFGSITPIPVGIRVLGVEHPKGLNCSREEGYKTNSFLLMFFFFFLISSFIFSVKLEKKIQFL